jgi:soluble lytic murein transglycosylase-like protein
MTTVAYLRCLVVLAVCIGATWAEGRGLKERDPAAPYQSCVDGVAKHYKISPQLLRAIVKVENGTWNPLAVSINRKGQGLPQKVHSYQEAVELVSRLWVQKENFDVGLGQVNTVNMERFRVHPVSLLDPCTNLTYAALILRESIDRHGYNWTAVERYNGRNPKYPWKVYSALKEVPR